MTSFVARCKCAAMRAETIPLTVILVLCLAFHAHSASAQPRATKDSAPLSALVTIDVQRVSLDSVLRLIDRQADLKLGYTKRVVPVDRIVSLTVRDVSAGDALRKVLAGTGVQIRISDAGEVTLVRPFDDRRAADSTATGAVRGSVVDAATNSPIEGATVAILELDRRKAVSGNDGVWVMQQLPAGDYTVVVRRLGYTPSRMNVRVRANEETTVRFALQSGVTQLDQVVTTATGDTRRVEVGNSIATVNAADEIARAPIRSLTDLLENRVPGLQVMRTSGSPGAPSRIRIRGVSSVNASNDPIVILDGVRIYNDQSSQRNGNLASKVSGGGPLFAPSPLDQIDPAMVETIDVLKGPSAAALYGTDAANGVIVIKTKRGRPGPAHWSFRAEQTQTRMPAGTYPLNFFRWGHKYEGGPPTWCSIGSVGCIADSVTSIQALNEPDMTPIGHGTQKLYSGGVTGGSETIQYSFSGNALDDIGLVKMPQFERERYIQMHSGAQMPSWQTRPQRLSAYDGTGRINVAIGSVADVSLTSMMRKQEQRNSSLESVFLTAMSTMGSRDSIYAGGLAPELHQRIIDKSLRATNALNANWRPSSFVNLQSAFGIDVMARNDELLLRRGDCPASSCGQDTVGHFATGRGTSTVYSMNLGSSFEWPLQAWLKSRSSIGTQFQRTTTSDLGARAQDIPFGDGTIEGGATRTAWNNNQDLATAGWYVEQSLALRERLYLSVAMRRDVGSALGTAVAPIYPKWSLSWLASDEPWFAPVRSFVSSFRLRSAFGQSGVQPAATDKLRTYAQTQEWVLGGVQSVLLLSNFGNDELRPERSVELEGGGEIGLLNDRASLDLTLFRKRTRDAIINRAIAPSVDGGGTRFENVGELQNTGLEATLTARLLETSLLSWNVAASFTRVRSLVNALGPGVAPFVVNTFPTTMIKPGYAPFSYWQRPIRGFADLNHDGALDPSEVTLGDSMVYMGVGTPDFETSYRTDIGLWGNRIRVAASVSYQSGLTQFNQPLLQRAYASEAFNQPGVSLLEQAPYAALGAGSTAGFLQTVSVLRFNDFSMVYVLPQRVTGALHVGNAELAVLGSNLGIHSNYDGRDPNVNSYSVGNLTIDGGAIPQPRRWTVRLNVGF